MTFKNKRTTQYFSKLYIAHMHGQSKRGTCLHNVQLQKYLFFKNLQDYVYLLCIFFQFVYLSRVGLGWKETSGDPGKALGTSFPGCFALPDAGVSCGPRLHALKSQLLITGTGRLCPDSATAQKGCCGDSLLQFLSDPVPSRTPRGHILHTASGFPSALSHPEEAFQSLFSFLLFPLLLLRAF